MAELTETKTGTATQGSGRQWPLTSLIALVGFIFVPSVMTITGVSGSGGPDDPAVPPQFDVADSGDSLAYTEPERSALGQLNAWVEDRVPGKELAFEFERTTTRIIDDNYEGAVAENEQVYLGEDGWLFINDAVDAACVSAEVEAEWTAEAELVGELLAAAGKRSILAIAPDRAIMVPELLGEIENDCEVQNAAVVERLGELPHVLNLASAVSGSEHALQLDTHWSPAGAAAGMQMIVNEIQPGLWDNPDIDNEVVDRPGDLDGLVGYENTETVNLLSIAQDVPTELEAVQTSLAGRPLVKATTLGAAAPKVLLIHDSFGGYFAKADPTQYQSGAGVHYLRPWFESVDNVRVAGDNAQSIADAAVVESIEEADVVVFLFVQRGLRSRLRSGLLSEPLAQALQAASIEN